MKKIVLNLDLHDDKAKQKAFRTVSTLSGIDFISVDMKGNTMTLIGKVDPIRVVSKLRKYWPSAGIISVGPAKEPEKKEEPKKEEPKKEEEKKGEAKEEPKKEEAKKEEPKKEEPKKEEPKKESKPDPVPEPVKIYRPYHPYMNSYYPQMNTHYPQMNTHYPNVNTYYHAPGYHAQSTEENPNTCVIL